MSECVIIFFACVCLCLTRSFLCLQQSSYTYNRHRSLPIWCVVYSIDRIIIKLKIDKKKKQKRRRKIDGGFLFHFSRSNRKSSESTVKAKHKNGGQQRTKKGHLVCLSMCNAHTIAKKNHKQTTTTTAAAAIIPIKSSPAIQQLCN